MQDPAILESWRERVELARRELRWPPGDVRASAHRTGASLALAAPVDQLITATEVNEWALAAAIAELSARTLALGGEVAIYDQQLRSRFDWLREPDAVGVASTAATFRYPALGAVMGL